MGPLFSESQSLTIMVEHGRKQAGKVLEQQLRDHTLILKQEAEVGILEMVWSLEPQSLVLVAHPPTRPHLLSLSKQCINWGLSMWTHDALLAILIQTTAMLTTPFTASYTE